MKVHRIDRPLIPGETVLVPVVHGVPCLWPPHKDAADGQPEWHWHPDVRFCDPAGGSARLTGHHTWEPRQVQRSFEIIEQARWHQVHHVRGGTPVQYIATAIQTMPCKNITNGRCPHRGFNMHQAPTMGGVKVCPLHGMRFRADNGRGLPYRTGTGAFDEEAMLRNDAHL